MNRHRIRKQHASKLPKELKDLFWDYDFAALRWETDRDFTIARVLTLGNWDAVIWLRSVVEDRALREWIQTHRGGGMSPQRLRFWELILGLSHRQVDGWLAEEGRRIWDRRRHV